MVKNLFITSWKMRLRGMFSFWFLHHAWVNIENSQSHFFHSHSDRQHIHVIMVIMLFVRCLKWWVSDKKRQVKNVCRQCLEWGSKNILNDTKICREHRHKKMLEMWRWKNLIYFLLLGMLENCGGMFYVYRMHWSKIYAHCGGKD
jgi:hypothetical protein